jgi:hypothetical protein
MREGNWMLHRKIPIVGEPGLIRHRLGPSKLYIDDVELIYDLLVDASNTRAEESGEKPAPVVITAGEAVADLVENLSDATPKELLKVHIALDQPLVSVDLWRRWAVVTAQSSDPKARELALSIRKYVKDKRSVTGVKLFKSLGDESLLALIITICIAIMLPLCYLMSVPDLWLINSGSAVGLFICAILGRWSFLYLSGTVKVVPRRLNEARRLTSEMRRQLFVALAAALIGGLAGLWAGGAIHH